MHPMKRLLITGVALLSGCYYPPPYYPYGYGYGNYYGYRPVVYAAPSYYWYHGRTDDMLKVSGIFVAPAEIENCLLQHEAVLECAVVGPHVPCRHASRDHHCQEERPAQPVQDFVPADSVPLHRPRNLLLGAADGDD